MLQSGGGTCVCLDSRSFALPHPALPCKRGVSEIVPKLDDSQQAGASGSTILCVYVVHVHMYVSACGYMGDVCEHIQEDRVTSRHPGFTASTLPIMHSKAGWTLGSWSPSPCRCDICMPYPRPPLSRLPYVVTAESLEIFSWPCACGSCTQPPALTTVI